MPADLPRILQIVLVVLACGLGGKVARAGDVLVTFGDMMRLQDLPLEAAERPLSDDEIVLYRNFELYAYSVFETLQVANGVAKLVDGSPLFCAPETTFHFQDDGDIARLAERASAELAALVEGADGGLERYVDQPASVVLLLGLRAAFPCDPNAPVLAQR